jgi:hypothetical protein
MNTMTTKEEERARAKAYGPLKGGLGQQKLAYYAKNKERQARIDEFWALCAAIQQKLDAGNAFAPRA